MNAKALPPDRNRALWQLSPTVAMEVFAVFLVALLVWSSNFAGVRDGVQYHRPSSPSQIQEPRLGAASSMSAACSKAGARILKAGGNAADAMIATEFCVGVVGFELTGLGGGGFTLIRMPNGSYDALDFREEAPAAATTDMFKNNKEASLVGGLASGVPGELRGLQYIHKHYASLPWKQLLQPAIDIAKNGFVIGPGTLEVFQKMGNSGFLTKDPSWAIDFAPNGTLLGLGDILTRNRYAALLKRIATEGPDCFYNGDIARSTIRAVQNAGGIMTAEDLAKYKPIQRDVMTITYRNFKITSLGAPSGGPVVLSILKTVEGYKTMGDLQSLNLSIHRLDEATRFGFGARAELGDPEFVCNVSAFQQTMISPSHTAKIRAKISDLHTLPIEAYNPNGYESLKTPGTSHIVTADASGLALSLTSSINTWLGSQIMVPETGVIMNNDMNDFSIPDVSNAFGYMPSPANFIKPGKRALSSNAPTIIEFVSNNTFCYALGAGGGSHIITGIIQGIWNLLDRDMSPLPALLEPRFHDQLEPNTVALDYRFNNTTAAYLAKKGHTVSWERRSSDLYVLKRSPNGVFEAVGEPGRKSAAGYAV